MPNHVMAAIEILNADGVITCPGNTPCCQMYVQSASMIVIAFGEWNHSSEYTTSQTLIKPDKIPYTQTACVSTGKKWQIIRYMCYTAQHLGSR